jgi:hypothetical protein
MDIETNNLNNGQMFFIFIGMLPFLALMPCWIVGKFIYEPYVKKFNEDLDKYMEELNKPPPYEYSNPLILTENPSKETKINNIVIDCTPDGYVAMRYNKKEDGFEYWSDKNVAYKYLETVARKYVNSFECSEVYINREGLLREKMQNLSKEIKENIEKELEEKKSEENIEKKNEPEEKTDVFVNLKKYNSSSKRTVELKKKITREDFVADQANKYIKKGKFKDSKEWMSPIKKKEKEMEDVGYVSWLSWKNKDN